MHLIMRPSPTKFSFHILQPSPNQLILLLSLILISLNDQAQSVDCISKRYPMVIGDSLQPDVAQTLTCLDISSLTGSQIIGGSTTSSNMASHATMTSTTTATATALKSTIFLVSIDLSGTIGWRKQYYNDLSTSSASEWFYQIQSCRISTDSSYIALTTLPYNIITVNLTNGDILKSFKHSSLTQPKLFTLSRFIYATSEDIYTGYTDDTYQWKVVRIPISYSDLSAITPTRSNQAAIIAAQNSLLQMQVSMTGFKRSTTASSTLFSGCVPTYASSYFYFSGYFTNSTGTFYRIGKFALSTGVITESYDGKSSDFGTSATGFMECAYATKSQDLLIVAIQNYADISSSTANANLKFWTGSIQTPISSKSFQISETLLYNTESGSAITQMVGMTYKQDSGIAIYMFQSKDLYNLKSTNLIYIPDKGTQYAFSQSADFTLGTPYSSSIKYYFSALYFIGYGQQFPGFISTTKPSLYIQGTSIKSDYAANTADLKTCWMGASSSGNFYINTAGTNDILMANVTSMTYGNSSIVFSDIFNDTSNITQSDDLFMVLDQYQPCVQIQTGLKSQASSIPSSSTCSVSTANARTVTISQSVALGQSYNQTFDIDILDICPDISSNISASCYSAMSAFTLLELSGTINTVSLPSFMTYNSNTLMLVVSPTDSSEIGTYSVNVIGINGYGMSRNLTYEFVVTLPSTPSSSSSTTSSSSSSKSPTSSSSSKTSSSSSSSNTTSASSSSKTSSSSSSTAQPSSSSSSASEPSSSSSSDTSSTSSSSSSSAPNTTNPSSSSSSVSQSASSSSKQSTTSSSSSAAQPSSSSSSAQQSASSSSEAQPSSSSSSSASSTTSSSSSRRQSTSSSSSSAATTSSSSSTAKATTSSTTSSSSSSASVSNTTDALIATILNFTDTDQLTVQFSQAIVTPSVSQSTLNSAINLTLNGPSGSITGITWNIHSINSTLMIADVSVNYSTSSLGRGGLQQLVLTFIDPSMFQSQRTYKNLTTYYLTFYRTYPSNDTSDIIGNKSTTINVISKIEYVLTSTAIVVGTMVGVISSETPQLWCSFIHTLQTMAFIPLIKITLPTIFTEVFISLKASFLSFLPFHLWLAEFSSVNYSAPYASNFYQLGYYTSAMFSNITDLVCTVILLVFAMLMFVFISGLVTKFCEQPTKVQNYDSQVPRKSSYNNVILLIKVTFLPILLFSLLNLINGDMSSLRILAFSSASSPFGNSYRSFNLALAVIFSIITSSFFFFCLFFVIKYKREIYVTQSLQDRFGYIFADSKPGLANYFYIVIFLLVRMAFVFDILFLQANPLAQLIVMISMEALLIVYLIVLRPFVHAWKVFIELFNETMILACFVLCVFLIPEYSTESKRFKIGCALFAVISLMIFINIIFVFAEAFINIKKTYDALRNKRTRMGDQYNNNTKISHYEQQMDISSIYQAEPPMNQQRDNTRDGPNTNANRQQPKQIDNIYNMDTQKQMLPKPQNDPMGVHPFAQTQDDDHNMRNPSLNVYPPPITNNYHPHATFDNTSVAQNEYLQKKGAPNRGVDYATQNNQNFLKKKQQEQQQQQQHQSFFNL